MTPRALIIAGPNGSGKTTFAEEYLRSESVSFLSADFIAEQIRATDPLSARVEAGRQFLVRLDRLVADKDPFALEATLAGATLARSIRQMKQAGYSISLVYIFLRSTEACRARIRERVAKGGHQVPDVDIRRRFSRSLKNFWTHYRLLADRWYLFYNGGALFHAVALGEGDLIEVHDEALFGVFQRLCEGKVG